MRRERMVLMLISLLSLLLPQSALAAQAVDCVMVQEDVGNGYRYEAPGIGGFSINGQNGETLSAAVISLDPGLEVQILRDGYEASFSDGVILDNGSYEMRIFREGEEEVYGVFHFAVQNSYGEMLGGEDRELVQISNPKMELDYDSQEGMFTYTLPDGETISSRVPFGGWSESRNDIELSDQLNVYRVLRDGQPQDFSEGLSFRLPGSYRVTIWDNELGLSGDTSYRIDYCFVLSSRGPRNISHISAPMGFQTESLLWNGIPLPIDSKDFVHLELDGSYEIAFESEDGSLTWQTSILRDTTAPTVTFTPDISSGQASEYVEFSRSEPDAALEIRWNGQQVEAYTPRLAMDGRYQITITDTAGNSRQYEFTLRKGYDIRGGFLIVLPVLLLAAAGGIVFYWRRNMRVL